MSIVPSTSLNCGRCGERIRYVQPMTTPLSRPPKDSSGLAGELIGDEQCLVTIKIDIDLVARRGSIEDGEIRRSIEILGQVMFGEPKAWPPLPDCLLLAVGNRSRFRRAAARARQRQASRS